MNDQQRINVVVAVVELKQSIDCGRCKNCHAHSANCFINSNTRIYIMIFHANPGSGHLIQIIRSETVSHTPRMICDDLTKTIITATPANKKKMLCKSFLAVPIDS